MPTIDSFLTAVGGVVDPAAPKRFEMELGAATKEGLLEEELLEMLNEERLDLVEKEFFLDLVLFRVRLNAFEEEGVIICCRGGAFEGCAYELRLDLTMIFGMKPMFSCSGNTGGMLLV